MHGRQPGKSISLPAFDDQRLDAFKVAREALRLGDALARRPPRGYTTLQDQLRRALLSAYLGIAEASSRQGADRLPRFRCARGEVCEAAAALEGVLVLNLAPEGEILSLLALLDRLQHFTQGPHRAAVSLQQILSHEPRELVSSNAMRRPVIIGLGEQFP